MVYDERLENRILSAIDGWSHVSVKKMFGGVCHLIHGNMFCGVYKDFLILRLGQRTAANALSQLHIKPFDIKGKTMKGWVMIEPRGLETDGSLNAWLKQARAFALTLAPK